MTTDEPDEQLAPASREDEARIRELLSGARVTEPMPADVAARLDDALVGLAAERPPIDPVPADNVIPITRTRRHRVVAVLGAAAAVVVLGVGVNAVMNSESGGDDDASSGSESAVDRGAHDDGDFEQAEAAPTEDAPGKAADDNAVARAYSNGGRAFAVRPGQLGTDLARLQAGVLTAPADPDYSAVVVYSPQDFECQLPSRGRGVLVGVRYDGDPAFVRFLEPMGESQVVEVLQCGTGDLLRSTTLPTHG